jgi:alkylated DNA repair dioxygenase AlkB
MAGFRIGAATAMSPVILSGGMAPIPERVLGIWRDLVSEERMPDCCLINYYGEDARMGMHQDRDEADFSWPVLVGLAWG